MKLERMTFSGVIHCDAWETLVQHRTVTFEKDDNTGIIKVDNLMSNVSYTTNEGSAIYANCESQIRYFFKGYLLSGVITSISGVGTMYCPKIYSSNDNYKNNVDVKVYYYDGKLMIVLIMERITGSME